MPDERAIAASARGRASSPPVLRPLGWFERLFWLLDQNRPRHFVLAAHVGGHTTPDQWRKALDAVQGRHPLLSAGIAVGDDALPYFHRVTDSPIPLRVLEGEKVGADWETEFARELALPFAPRQAPLMRAVLLQERQRAVCILSTHHAIGDGMSVAYIVRDLLQALTGTTLQPLPLLPAYDELVGRIAGRLDPAAIARGLEPGPAGPPAEYRARDGAMPQIRTLQLAPGLLAQLRHRARAEQATVHGALCSGLSLCVAELIDRPATEPIRIWSPMDVRQLLDLGHDCAMLATSLIVPVLPRGLPGFWEVARGVAAKLAERRTVEYLAATVRLLHRDSGRLDVASAAQLMAQRFRFDFVVTNLGVLPYESRFGDFTLEMLGAPAVLSGFENEHVFGIATTGARLSITYSSCTPSASLFERLERILAAACA